MSQGSNYSQLMRPVGQMLESLGVQSFVLTIEGDDFSVRTEQRAEAPQPPETKSLRAIWQLLRAAKSAPEENPAPSSGVMELHYTPEDIARVEAEGRGRRAESAPAKAPEAHALSQILRACGAFVDQKEGRILAVKKDHQKITIDYESNLKRRVSEEFTVASLYDYWVKMYLKRRARAGER
jgi:hypothetical protein